MINTPENIPISTKTKHLFYQTLIKQGILIPTKEQDICTPEELSFINNIHKKSGKLQNDMYLHEKVNNYINNVVGLLLDINVKIEIKFKFSNYLLNKINTGEETPNEMEAKNTIDTILSQYLPEDIDFPDTLDIMETSFQINQDQHDMF
ncbi:hypothetical protein HN924_02260 [Candidatus Woesearchaeota archaeon]|jgi:hypothetical protein|nr:hypothetical protein [Candidatus Woesearchaeota archaeon]MBT7062767.1 hypothetical protein [Candidatus Woesearchaeota archaeon]MBT7402411.1 hypothetical protein [Candidatus Woesearchaeota archaeon]